MAVKFDSILGKLRQEDVGESSSESKIIHVINREDILLLEDDIDYYNRIKNLSVGDLFFWNDRNYTYYYDSSATRKIELEKNCIYRIIPFDSFPKIERVDIGSSSGGSSESTTDISISGATGNYTLHLAGVWEKSAFSAELAEDGTIVIASGAEIAEDGTIVLSGGELATNGTIVL